MAENTLLARPPINRIVPTTNTKITANTTAYSACLGPLFATRDCEANQSCRTSVQLIKISTPHVFLCLRRTMSGALTILATAMPNALAVSGEMLMSPNHSDQVLGSCPRFAKDNTMNRAESLIRTLLASGVDVCFANSGTSEIHLVAVLDRVTDTGDRARATH
jgi:hypothetical protein